MVHQKPHSVSLEVEGDDAIHSPSADDIAHAITNLRAGDDGYVTVSQGERTYLQVSSSSEGEYSAEYQDGSFQERYRSIDAMTLNQAIAAMESYARGGSEWKTGCRWEKVSVHATGEYSLRNSEADSSSGKIVICCIVAVCMAIGLLASRDKAHKDQWVLVFIASVGVGIVVMVSLMLRAGSMRVNHYVIERRKNPVQFWWHIVTGYLCALLVFCLVAYRACLLYSRH